MIFPLALVVSMVCSLRGVAMAVFEIVCADSPIQTPLWDRRKGPICLGTTRGYAEFTEALGDPLAQRDPKLTAVPGMLHTAVAARKMGKILSLRKLWTE